MRRVGLIAKVLSALLISDEGKIDPPKIALIRTSFLSPQKRTFVLPSSVPRYGRFQASFQKRVNDHTSHGHGFFEPKRNHAIAVAFEMRTIFGARLQDARVLGSPGHRSTLGKTWMAKSAFSDRVKEFVWSISTASPATDRLFVPGQELIHGHVRFGQTQALDDSSHRWRVKVRVVFLKYSMPLIMARGC